VDVVEQFARWAIRGRGHQIWPRPVALEPAFVPFFGYTAAKQVIVDDGRRRTWLSTLADVVLRRGRAPAEISPPDPAEAQVEPEPDAAVGNHQRAEFRLLLPRAFEMRPAVAERLAATLASSAYPVSYEIIGDPDRVALLLTCSEYDAPHLRQQLAAYAPDVALIPESGYLAGRIQPGKPNWVVELGFSCDWLYPLQSLAHFPVDPLTGLFAVLSGLSGKQCGVVQVLFQEVARSWSESAYLALHGDDGRPHGFVHPDLVSHAKRKLAKPLVSVVLRVATQSHSEEDALHLLSRICASLCPFDVPLGQELVILPNDGYDDLTHLEDLTRRTTHRSGMLLNVEELAALTHLPGAAIAHPRFERFTKRTKPAPEQTSGHELVLGRNVHLGQEQIVSLAEKQRLRHVYCVGATGTGKSTLLLSMITQDVAAGRGVLLLDPHGDLVDGVLARIPESRLDDVALIDPADKDFPVGFNLLAAQTELERTLLASDLVAIFRRLSASWGDQMQSVWANAILAFLESDYGGTLSDLRRFLVDRQFRAEFLKTVQDPEITYYWQHEFPLLKGNPHAPILTRLDTFLRPRLIRNMVCQHEKMLDFGKLMDEGRIVLAKLSHGAIGEENSYLLGALIVAKLNQAALARQDRPEAARRPFFLYADEFHHFATPSMASIASGTRKYGLGMVLAHQSLGQLGGRSDEIASSLLTNAATRVVFRVGDSDVRHFAEGFAAFDGNDLQNLGIGEAIVRVERRDLDFNLQTFELAPVDDAVAAARAEAARAASRARYATPRLDIEPAELPAPKSAPAPPAKAAPAAAAPPLPTAASSHPPVAVPAVPRPRSPASSPGRGGKQHKYLQTLIKQFGEDRGFRASLEQAVLDGHGHVDVALQRDDMRIAVEITVTTPTAHELGNVRKCLAAGFDQVLLVAADEKARKRLDKALTAELETDLKPRVTCILPDEIPMMLDQAAPPTPSSTTVAGYKVNVQFTPAGVSDARARRQALQGVIGRSLKRLSEPES
jgi:hypothetical protein